MSRRKILVIDDDRASSDLIERALEPRGCDVMREENPEDGLSAAVEMRPDLIFISLLFAGSNGLKLSKAIHSIKDLKHIPIIMLISYQGELDPKYTVTIGIVDVLVKPLNEKEIISKTRNFLVLSAPGVDVGAPSVEEPDIASLDREWFADLDKEGAEFVQEGRKLVDKAILATGEKPGIPEIIPVGNSDPESDTAEEEREVISGWADDEDIGQDAEKTDRTEDVIPIEYMPPEFETKEEVPETFHVVPEQKVMKEEDEMRRCLAEETDIQDKELETPVEHEHHAEPKAVSSRRIYLISASVLIIAGIGAGAFVANKFFFGAQSAVRERAAAQPPAVAGGKEAPPVVDTAKEQKAESAPTAAEVRGSETAPPDKDVKGPAKEKPEDVKTGGSGNQGGYAIQVGVFAEEKNALSLAEKLKQKGYEASVLKDGKRPLHRVLIGRFDTGRKASEVSRLILQKDGIKSVIYRF